MSKIWLFCKVAECCMISVYSKVPSFEVNSPFLEGMHNSQGLLFMSCIVSFILIHLAGGECHRLWSIALILGEDSSNSIIRGISGNCEGQ